jgi:lipid-binding SYLF domain-containing protein
MKQSCKQRHRGLGSTPCNAVLVWLLVAAHSNIASAEHKKPPATSKLRAAAHILQEISAEPQNAIPDAVLNRTKCVVVIPSMNAGPSNSRGDGVSTCRDGATEWTVPAFVQFNGHGIRAKHAALLVFVLSEKGVNALRFVELEIPAARGAPAPLVRTSPVTATIELHAELLTYQYSAGVLSGSKAYGVIRRSAETSNAIAKQIPKQINDQYRSSVISFFNTITATGIVFHHTALIPGEKTVPRRESDIDEYHRERGFEILCSGRVYHVAYHYLIMPNGVIKAGRPERCEGAHAVGYNSYLGISLVGDFSSEDNPNGGKGPIRPSAQQLASLVRLCRRLRRRYKIPVQHIIRHSDIANTQCPGDRFPFKSVLEQLQKGPR